MAENQIHPQREIVTRQQAEHDGLRRFFTGEPCHRGHVSERYAKTGACRDCSLENAANRKARDPDLIRKEFQARYRGDGEFRQKVIERSRAHYRDNREHHKSGKRARHAANRDHDNAMCRERWAAYRLDPEWLKRERKRKLDECKAHPERWRASRGARRARMKNMDGKFTAKDVLEILNAQGYRCVYCRKDIRAYYEIDHILPVAKGGVDWPYNLQCLCGPCNRHKSAKWPDVFEKEIGWRC